MTCEARREDIGEGMEGFGCSVVFEEGEVIEFISGVMLADSSVEVIRWSTAPLRPAADG